jgi:N6-L-threonylcarbamoyladenine synthase
LILSFDTSTPECCAAVTRGGTLLAMHSEDMPRGQAEALMVICEGLIEKAGYRVTDLDAIGVGIGPGNFTGIRISVAAARGLSLGLGIPAVGVSAFDALREGREGPCQCVVEAPRHQVYVQYFDAEGIASEPALVQEQDLPPPEGPRIGHAGHAPVLPRVQAIAAVTLRRYRDQPPRPAPLYLRAADAAPARDVPPVILR